MPQTLVRIIRCIDAWTNKDNFVTALQLQYSDDTKSAVFGDADMVPTKQPQSWIRKEGERISELSGMAFASLKYCH